MILAENALLTVISGVAFLLGIAATVGMTLAVLRVNLYKAQAEGWKGEWDAQKAKSDRLASDMGEIKGQHQECQATLREMRRDHEALRKLVFDALRDERPQSIRAYEEATRRREARRDDSD